MASGGEEDKINMQNGVLTAASCIFPFWGCRFLILRQVKKMCCYQNAAEKYLENFREDGKFICK